MCANRKYHLNHLHMLKRQYFNTYYSFKTLVDISVKWRLEKVCVVILFSIYYQGLYLLDCSMFLQKYTVKLLRSVDLSYSYVGTGEFSF